MGEGPTTRRFHIGCAVWAFDGWIGEFYPEGSRARELLRLYGERLTAVEGNTTFYATPEERTVAGWAAQLPETFRFCPKLPRDVSHAGRLAPGRELARTFRERLRPLGPRLGTSFLQLPHTYGPELQGDLRAFLLAWPLADAPLAVEVRHPAWYRSPHRENLRALLADVGAHRVVLDTRAVYSSADDPQADSKRRKPELPVVPEAVAGRAFVRFIGHPDLAHSERYLLSWAAQVDAWLRAGTEVYFFLHCPREERSPWLARRFQELLEARGAPVPALPWSEVRPPERQATLF